MENLHLESTKFTPEINFNAQEALLKVSGKSFPENTFEFYEPILKWLEEYLEQASDATTIAFQIIYCNSTTSKILYDMFDLFQGAHDEGKVINIKWEFIEENDAALEIGEDFVSDFEELNIELVQID